jgi:hypothetical protein
MSAIVTPGNKVADVTVMTDRRRQPRSVFVAPADAQVEIVVDAVIERWSADHITVISPNPALIGDRFVISSQHLDQPWEATVLSCEPVFSALALRHRLNLSIPPDRTHKHTGPIVM